MRTLHCYRRYGTAFFVIAITFYVTLAFGAAPPVAPSGQHTRSTEDVVCGPRCLRYILRHYGKQSDLIDLVRAIQWPDIKSGSSLASIEAVLRKNEIATQALYVPVGANVKWDHPVLIHCSATEATPAHYIVLLATAGGTARIYCGLDGCRSIKLSELASLRSGVVLLTASSPTIDAKDAISAVRYSVRQQCVRLAPALLGSLALLTLLTRFKFCRRHFRRKKDVQLES